MRRLTTHLIWTLLITLATGQTTGKIAGLITRAADNAPLVGVNIMLADTDLGTATDQDGAYFIINVPPGSYNVRIVMIGCKTVIVEDVQVSVNRTANVDAQLEPTLLEGELVTVRAARIARKKDQTSSVKNISAKSIELLPVNSISDVVEMQTGVVQGHFRGGRLTEVSYLIDGVQVDEKFAGESGTVELDPEVVADLEVITGTFNAEYGRAMSGIVNVVTKDGSDTFQLSLASHQADYLTSNDNIFVGLEEHGAPRNQEYRLQVEGPVLPRLTFFTNFRLISENGHLNGIERFRPGDYSNFDELNCFASTNFADTDLPGYYATPYGSYYSEISGDGEYVPMETRQHFSGLGKLTYNHPGWLKVSYTQTLEEQEWQNYDHYYKYKPGGRATNYEETAMSLLQLNHMLSPRIFQELKLSHTSNWRGLYLYENPLDPRFVSKRYERSVGGFASGGSDRSYTDRTTSTSNLKYDLNVQLNAHHALKTGFLYSRYRVENNPVQLEQIDPDNPVYTSFGLDTVTMKVIIEPEQYKHAAEEDLVIDDYCKKPEEVSVYFQDKMEFQNLVINLGLRYDWFRANSDVPSQLRNPSNQLFFEDPAYMTVYKDAEPQWQLSPRLGLSYILSRAAVLHFSYGHFFQIPPFYALYQNYRFQVPTTDFATVHGNAEIEAEKTVQYELGIWQELMPGMGLELSIFYRDIYDLQSAVTITTFDDKKYGRYDNRDYGNAKGFELKYDYLWSAWSFMLNYTLQYTRGVADDPNALFDLAGQNFDPIPVLVPLSWDQRHTLNASLTYQQPNWGSTLTGFYNSGLPYTIDPLPESPLAHQRLYPNNATRPSTLSFNLKSYLVYPLDEGKRIKLTLTIHNLFDTLNEQEVYGSTGRAYTDIITGDWFISNFNTQQDRIQNPSMYSAPREIRFGVEINY